MAIEIKDVYKQLQHLKNNLVKLSYPKRTTELLQQKFNEAIQLRNHFDEILEGLLIEIEQKKLPHEVLKEIQNYGDLIKDLYLQIEAFCSKDYSSLLTVHDIEGKTDKMENFDFKTATSMLPVMTGAESVTKSLIDAIDLYSSSLNEDGKKMLIKFVLKTRLSENAKLRLSDTYDSIESLMIDMRNHLLTQKSSTAIHKQLVSIKQNGTSLDNYGEMIEQLFVDLTISEAKGDPSTYKVLRPRNEKIAIQSFADGLYNRNLSTVISAHNYSTLKDAIRGAKDHEASCSQQNTESMYVGQRGQSGRYSYYRGNNRGNFNNRGNNYIRNPRGRNYQNNQSQGRGTYQQYHQYEQSQQWSPQRGNNSDWQSGYRGRYGNYSRRRGSNIYYVNTDNIPSTSQSDQQQNSGENSDSKAEIFQFFR